MFVHLSVFLWWWRDRGNVPFPPRTLWVPFVALAAASAVSAVVNEDPLGNLLKLRTEYRIFLPFFLAPLLYLAGRRGLLYGLAGGVLFAGLLGLFQMQTIPPPLPSVLLSKAAAAHSRAQGFFSTALTYGGVLGSLAALFFALGSGEKAPRRWFWLLVALTALLAVSSSGSRSSVVGMAAGCAAVAVSLPRRHRLWIWAVVSLVCAALISLVAAGSWNTSGKRESGHVLVRRIRYTTLKRERIRLHLWESALAGVSRKPLFGYGHNNTHELDPFLEQVAKEHGVTAYKKGLHTHNIYFQVLFNFGLVGFAAFLALWASVISWIISSLIRAGPSHERERALLWGCLGGLVCALVAGLFENNIFDAEVQATLLILIGLAYHGGMSVRGLPAPRES